MYNPAHEVLKKGRNRRIATGTAITIGVAALGAGFHEGASSGANNDSVRINEGGIVYVVPKDAKGNIDKTKEYRKIDIPIMEKNEKGQWEVTGHNPHTGENQPYISNKTQQLEFYEGAEQVTPETAFEHSRLIEVEVKKVDGLNEIVATPGQGINELQTIAHDEAVTPSTHAAKP